MPDMWMNVDSALAEVPVNMMPLIDDTDFKTVETAVAYTGSGVDLVWNFVTSAGAMSQTAVTPTTGGDYDWAHQGDGMYSIEIPASGGASINNDTEGYGWFTGVATGVLPWRGPIIGFRASTLNDALCDGGDYLDVNLVQIEGASASTSSAQFGVNVVTISGDGTAANNCEAFFDDTGFNASNSTIGTCTVNSDMITTADVNTEVDTALADYDPPTKAEMDSGFAALNDVSTSDVNAACDTALSDYDPPTKTEMDSGFAALNDVSTSDVNAACDSALADYDPPTHAEMTAAIGALENVSVDEVWAKACSDITAVPAITASVLAAVNWIFALSKNALKTDGTNSELVLFKDDSTTVIGEAQLSDDGTDFLREKWGAAD